MSRTTYTFERCTWYKRGSVFINITKPGKDVRVRTIVQLLQCNLLYIKPAHKKALIAAL